MKRLLCRHEIIKAMKFNQAPRNDDMMSSPNDSVNGAPHNENLMNINTSFIPRHGPTETAICKRGYALKM
jgi:hypothetical protein